MRHSTPYITLSSSLSAIWHYFEIDCSYRTLARRVSMGRLGYGRCMSRSGKCDYCSTWDNVEEPHGQFLLLRISGMTVRPMSRTASIIGMTFVRKEKLLLEEEKSSENLPYIEKYLGYIGRCLHAVHPELREICHTFCRVLQEG